MPAAIQLAKFYFPSFCRQYHQPVTIPLQSGDGHDYLAYGKVRIASAASSNFRQTWTAQQMDSDSVVQAQRIDFQGQVYPLLEAYLGMPLVGQRHLQRLIRIIQQKEAWPADLPDTCCIIFEVDQDNNAAMRAAEIALNTWRARVARRKFARLTGNRAELIGIYPKLDNPTVIFELDTPAADYVHRDVLPDYGQSPSATIKRFVAKLIKTDPSLSGIGVVVRLR